MKTFLFCLVLGLSACNPNPATNPACESLKSQRVALCTNLKTESCRLNALYVEYAHAYFGQDRDRLRQEISAQTLIVNKLKKQVADKDADLQKEGCEAEKSGCSC